MSKLQDIVNSLKEKPKLTLIKTEEVNPNPVAPQGNGNLAPLIEPEQLNDNVERIEFRQEIKNFENGKIFLRSLIRRGDITQEQFENVMMKAELAIRKKFGKFL